MLRGNADVTARHVAADHAVDEKGQPGGDAVPVATAPAPVPAPDRGDPPPPPSTGAVRKREAAVALRNALKMGSSLLVTWSVALIVKLQVPAHLGPVRQGHFGFAESFAMMFFAFIGFGVDMYLAKEVAVRPKVASDVVGGLFALRSAASVVLLAAMAGVLALTGRPRDVLLASIVFGVSNLLMTNNSTLSVILNTTSRVGAAAISNITAKILWGAGVFVGLMFNAPLPVLALPGLIGEVMRATVMLPATRREAGLRLRIDVHALRNAIVESVPYFVNSLALSVLNNLGMSVLGFISRDEREVGWFAAVQNIAYLCSLLTPLLTWVVMPLLSRAYARSEDEGLAILRRVIEGLVVIIVPITVLISAGSDFLVRIAFGWKYAPASLGLSILSLVFVMTYIDMMLAMALIISGRGWSVTVLSIGAVLLTSALMFIFVPLGRRVFGEGGECAGAAMSVIASEVFTLGAMLTRFPQFPLDGRDLRVLGKSVALGMAILAMDHGLRPIGPARLVVDAFVYAGAALATGVVRVKEVFAAVRLLRPSAAGTGASAVGVGQ
ncbi:MAG: oligosaccharide flippase family protein [Polyangiaceae bacterium]|nr:oligosaccharide flippase family protein [Polyangiaceae bacterium]